MVLTIAVPCFALRYPVLAPLSFVVISCLFLSRLSLQVTVGAVQACVDDVEYALRLMQKAALARQARDSAQTPEGLRSSGGLRGAAGDSQSSGTVSEVGVKLAIVCDDALAVNSTTTVLYI